MIALVALFRPGPLRCRGSSDNFIDRKHGREDFLPGRAVAALKPETGIELTYSIVLYQEQVMQSPRCFLVIPWRREHAASCDGVQKSRKRWPAALPSSEDGAKKRRRMMANWR
ncbi:hypothetical protein ACNKHS_01215 [Shigella flexneri]